LTIAAIITGLGSIPEGFGLQIALLLNTTREK
jgi:hypothetical protein